MSYTGIDSSEYHTYYSKFTKGFRIGDKVKSPHHKDSMVIGAFNIDGATGSTVDDFLTVSTREDILFSSIHSEVYVIDNKGILIGTVSELEILDDGLFSFSDYEKDKPEIQKYPEVDEFLKKHNLTIEQHYIIAEKEYKPCIVFNGKFIDDNHEESIKKILSSLLGFKSIKVKDISGNVIGTVASTPHASLPLTASIFPVTPYGVSNPITYLELWARIQKEAELNFRVVPSKNIVLLDTRTKNVKDCENYRTLEDLSRTSVNNSTIVRVCANGEELDFNGIKVGHNILNITSMYNGTIVIQF